MEQINQRIDLLKTWINEGEITSIRPIEDVIKKLDEIENLAKPLPTLVENYGGENGRYYKARSGRKFYIDTINMGFIDAIQKLPIEVRGKIVGLNEIEVEEWLTDKRQYMSDWVLKTINTKWYYRETGDKAIFDDPAYMPFNMSLRQIKSSLKKGKLTIKQMEEIIEHFLGEKSEYYTK